MHFIRSSQHTKTGERLGLQRGRYSAAYKLFPKGRIHTIHYINFSISYYNRVFDSMFFIMILNVEFSTLFNMIG